MDRDVLFTTAPLPAAIGGIHCSMRWHNCGTRNSKGWVWVELHRGDESLFGGPGMKILEMGASWFDFAPHGTDNQEGKLENAEHPLLALSQPGDVYKVCYQVGGLMDELTIDLCALTLTVSADLREYEVEVTDLRDTITERGGTLGSADLLAAFEALTLLLLANPTKCAAALPRTTLAQLGRKVKEQRGEGGWPEDLARAFGSCLKAYA